MRYSNLNDISIRLVNGKKLTISYPTISRTIPANPYVSPYAYAEFFYLDESIIKTYGQIISASVLADNTGAPVPCNFDSSTQGTYFRISSSHAANTIYLTCMKIEDL